MKKYAPNRYEPKIDVNVTPPPPPQKKKSRAVEVNWLIVKMSGGGTVQSGGELKGKYC